MILALGVAILVELLLLMQLGDISGEFSIAVWRGRSVMSLHVAVTVCAAAAAILATLVPGTPSRSPRPMGRKYLTAIRNGLLVTFSLCGILFTTQNFGHRVELGFMGNQGIGLLLLLSFFTSAVGCIMLGKLLKDMLRSNDGDITEQHAQD